jgi:glucan phosphoethanolaminetransferase (alkaline phosphatase superfamily)
VRTRLARLRRLAPWRRRLRWVLLASPLLLVWALDASNRAPRMLAFRPVDAATYLLASLETLAVWASLLVVASRRRGPVRLAALLATVPVAAFLLGGQTYFYDQYVTYLNADAARFGAAVGRNVLNHLGADAANFARFLAAPALVVVLLLMLARTWLRPPRTLRRGALVAAPLALLVALAAPCADRYAQAATPDVIFLHALGRLLASRMGLVEARWQKPLVRSPEYLPALRATPSRPRNVLLVVTESLRADVVCSALDPACATTPFSNAAEPDRIPLLGLRANDSTTAISALVLWSGMSPNESAEAARTSPMLWDYAHAAGWATAYTTSQNLDFAYAREFLRDLPIDRRCDAPDLAPHSDPDIGAPDEVATERALRDIASLREPFFAVVHYSNTHFPYRVSAQHAPFKPADDTKDPARNDELFNYYRDAVYLNDMAVGALLRGARALPSGPRTVVLYTSDHGEAFREHYQLGHAGSVFEEEIRVPGWIAAPPGTLDEHERAALWRASRAYTWHLDLAPTVLDLIGLWDAPEVARFRARMIGTSLLRGVTAGAVPLSNCAVVWGCPFRNWGMMKGRLKLEARQWDARWHCFDVEADPRERNDLGPERCEGLADLAMGVYGKLPRD